MESHSFLVTGGAGFVGSALLRRLLASTDRQRRIVVVDNLASGRREYLPDDPRIELLTADITDRVAIREIVATHRPQTVIHLAAIHFIPLCNEQPDRCLATNVIGTQNVLDALDQVRPKRVVIASSAAVYPICDDECREDATQPGPTDVYGLSKQVNEQQLAQFAARTGVRCAAGRLFNVFGPRETNPHVLPEIINQVLAGVTSLKLGNVEPKRDYVYVDDIAAALVAMSERNEQSFAVFNVGTGREYSVRELVEQLTVISGRSLSIEIDPQRVRKSDRLHLRADCRRIGSTLGWQPQVSLAEGLAKTWNWAAQQALS